jgi:hypothetical protein
MDSTILRIVSYNMHGFNQGSVYLKDLSENADVIFVQEHWLYPNNLHCLSDLCPDFVCFSYS